MSSSSFPHPLRREPFFDAGAPEPATQRLLRLLLAQDGSTTRLCETIAGGPVGLQLLRQAFTADVHALVRQWLPGSRFIERITSLVAHGEVMMDNLAYIALDGLEPSVQRDLEAGVAPIGHLLARMWVRREPVSDAGALHERLWSAVGVPDAAATRAYRIVTPEGPRMLIVETYRRGMRMVPR
jgi:chorismate-pyruvate lyase